MLNEVQSQDDKDVFEILSDEEVVKFYDLDSFSHLSQVSELIPKLLQDASFRTAEQFVI
ncbi:hypothetical protein [Pseudoalteromonas sp. '520P1 No. 423']|uniref:hypothetical protein n=1 Tax=Pseudoalteromonas sp. '520P1 No. 423' TaxID=1690037 RepID=UPI000A44A207|nr:hypothetical protein [Pseudoalteromonas sp. '520P1 No. 423']